MKTYRSKPTTIKAAQYIDESRQHLFIREMPVGLWGGCGGRGELIGMKTIHGQVAYAAPGDWIIQEPGDPQCFYPCKPEVFAARYADERSADDTPPRLWWDGSDFLYLITDAALASHQERVPGFYRARTVTDIPDGAVELRPAVPTTTASATAREPTTADALADLVRRMDKAEGERDRYRQMVDVAHRSADDRVRDLQREVERREQGLLAALWRALDREPGTERDLIETIRNLASPRSAAPEATA